ncbi:putative pentatricopeptide repeat-containing protein At1g56570 [Arachis stenosperma]|uniref:putative pentatricopeptide repeat-containing protein At1g56570 n=1 Tax=Arachis stenosperma TaxID=217475 RepID=UPI0025AD9B8A|nr:putative pentatricopeptide repeat-containing protein At1g56570 [Arachis stenosperma]
MMTSTRKLLSPTHFRPIPTIVHNSLADDTQLNSIAPFCPKDISGLATDLIKSYFDKGSIEEARMLFDEMSHRDVVTWTAMITSYNSCNHNGRAWSVFCEMLRYGTRSNEFTLSAVLKTCKGLSALLCGKLVHGLAIKNGTQGSSIYVDNALMDVYATCCSSMDSARMVFESILNKNAVSWTTLITGYTHRGDAYGGLRAFRQMLLEEGELSPFSFSIAVRACASTGLGNLGKQVHAAVINHGFESNLPVMNSILDMYFFKSCSACEAKQLFFEISQKDTITWNTLIAGFETLDPKQSFCIFSQMVSEGFSPNCFTFTSVAAACGNLAFLYCGQQLHGGIFRRGFNNNLALSNALIDMYGKCGNITDSHKIFSQMPCKNLVSWTSMMIGYGAHGHGKEATKLFNEMVRSGIKPDRIVFMAVLSACSHAGLVDEGLRYFRLLTRFYNLAPDQEIYGCVVDLLGHAGRVKEAYQLIENIPFKPDESIWVALLGACKAHKQRSIGKLAASRMLEMKPNRAGTYVLLSNFFAAEGNWTGVACLRKLMRGIKNKKEAGMSWIELKNQVYSFVVGGEFVSSNEQIVEVLEVLITHMKDFGYTLGLDCFVHDQENEV